MSKIKHFLKSIDKNTYLAIIAVVGVVVAGALIYVNSNSGSSFSLNDLSFGFGASSNQIAEKAVKYINDNKLSQSEAALVGNATQESGVIKFKIQIGSNEFDSYATKDGKFLFPQVVVMEPDKTTAEPAAGTGETPKTAADIKKVDNPMLEAYIVSRCPFGLQMQRVMAEAIKTVPELGKYMKSMYMGSVASDGKSITAMHGEAEATENLRQICIRDEQASKYWDYVSCQMKASGTETACEKSTGIDSAKLNACMSDTSRGVAYAKEDFDLTTKYNVTGSPTLILGEANISEFDFGGRTPEALKTIVCAAFNSQPSFCSTTLSTEQAAASFSPTYSSGSETADAANCAPAQ